MTPAHQAAVLSLLCSDDPAQRCQGREILASVPVGAETARRLRQDAALARLSRQLRPHFARRRLVIASSDLIDHVAPHVFGRAGELVEVDGEDVIEVGSIERDAQQALTWVRFAPFRVSIPDVAAVTGAMASRFFPLPGVPAEWQPAALEVLRHLERLASGQR